MTTTKRVYLDAAAATALTPKVAKVYVRALALYGNPSAPHAEGRAARDAIEHARTQIARSLNVKPEELLITSGGTESNNLALHGVAKGHVITTTLEHSSVAHASDRLVERGVRVSRVAPDKSGLVSVDEVLKEVRPQTTLVSLHHVQSECGVVQRVKDIALAVKKVNPKIVVHVDAAQSPLWLECSPHTLGADLCTYDAQKVGGPKGVGVLYRSFDIPLTALMGGGTQERGLRPGTENTAAIVAAGVAFEEAKKGRKERVTKVTQLRDVLAQKIRELVPEAVVLGSLKRRVANNLFLAIPGVDGDYLAVLMDTEGVAVTPRSACLGSGGALSETAYALTHDESLARSTIRFSLTPTTTKSDVDRAARALAKVLPLSKA